MFLAMTAVLPRTLLIYVGDEARTIAIGGKEKLVCWFDCDLKFDVRRLATMLHAHLLGQLAQSEGFDPYAHPEIIGDLVKDFLGRRLLVFRPNSTLELAATLRNLPEYYKASTGTAEIGYVLIDGMSCFSFTDALAAADAKQQSNVNPTTSPSTQPSMRQLLSALAHVRTSLSPIIYITNFALRTDSITHRSIEGYPFYQPHLLPPWPLVTSPALPSNPADPDDGLLPPLLPSSDSPSIVLHHITLHPPQIDIIPRGTSLADVLRKRDEMDQRQREDGMEGFVGVLRVAAAAGSGGTEVGSWSFDVKSAGLES